MLMKRIGLGIFALVMLAISASAIPGQISYQGILKDSSGNLVSSSGLSMVFSIYAATTGGAALWTETQSSVTVEAGVYSVSLGSVSSIETTVFDGTTRYLGVAVGADSEMTPRMPLITVPYAFRSSVADSVADGAVATAKLGATSVTAAKLGSDVAGTGLTGGNGAALAVDSGTAAGKILKLDGDAKIPAVNGSLLTSVNADTVDGVHGKTPTYSTVTSAVGYQLSTTDCVAFVTTGGGVVTITLPAVSVGKIYYVYKVDDGGGSISVAAAGGTTINGAGTAAVAANQQYNGMMIIGVSATEWIGSLMNKP